MYFTYILYSSLIDKYYVGHTSDVNNRLISHNKGSNNYTKKGMPWSLVYKKQFETKTEAIIYENSIKKMKSKKYIKRLIDVG